MRSGEPPASLGISPGALDARKAARTIFVRRLEKCNTPVKSAAISTAGEPAISTDGLIE